MKCPFLSLTIIVLKSIMSDTSIASAALFYLLFEWHTFFHTSTFDSFVSLNLRCASWKQYVVESFFKIHSASVCLFIEVFYPFTPNEITHHIYSWLFCYFFYVLCLFCSSIPPSLLSSVLNRHFLGYHVNSLLLLLFPELYVIF